MRNAYGTMASPCGRLMLAIVLLAMTPISQISATPLEFPESLRADESARIAAVERASSATLAIFGADKSAGGGSGVLITRDGLALTNFHVVQPCGNHLMCGMNDGQIYDAVVVGIDPTGDLALIKLLGRDAFPTVTVGDSDQVKVGEPCFAVGNPFLLATDLHPTVTYGVVSGVRRYQPPASIGILEYTDCIQTDAAINPGNSGGPLFNGRGELIGINGRGSFEKRGRVSVGVGYAISMRQAQNFLGVLQSGRVVDHATLGATVATDDSGAVVVTNILDASDAYRRGLRYGDEIIALAGRKIDTANTLKNVLGILPQGWRVPIIFQQEDQRVETYVRLAGVHAKEVLWKLAQRDIAPPTPDDRPPKRDDKKQEGKLPKPIENLRKRLTAKKKIPDAIAKVFQPRRGFANYHFNRLHRDRVWNALDAATQATGRSPAWVMVGKVEQRGSLELTFDGDHVAAKSTLPEDNHDLVMAFSNGLEQFESPRSSGGLYLAIHLWRRLMTLGPEQFGEVQYWGTAQPLPDHDGLFDVLVATHDVVESRFYFDPRNGKLVAMEMFPDIEVDPCELYFDDYREVDGPSLFPFSIKVIHGDHQFGTFQLESFQRKPVAKEGT